MAVAEVAHERDILLPEALEAADSVTSDQLRQLSPRSFRLVRTGLLLLLLLLFARS